MRFFGLFWGGGFIAEVKKGDAVHIILRVGKWGKKVGFPEGVFLCWTHGCHVVGGIKDIFKEKPAFLIYVFGNIKKLIIRQVCFLVKNNVEFLNGKLATLHRVHFSVGAKADGSN